jgi:hypothetical protein
MNDITRRYLERIAAHRTSPATFTAAAAASPLLRTAYEGAFLTRPAFLDNDEVRGLESDLCRLYDLLVSLPERISSGDLRGYAAAAGLNTAQIEAVERLRSDRPPRLGRADLYQDSEGFKVLEFNLGSPLGGLENPELNRAMLASPVLAEFAQQEHLGFRDTVASVARTVLRSCHHSQAETRPVMAIVDTPAYFAKVGRRLQGLARLFRGHGLDAFACDASQLTVAGDRVVADGRTIDVIYRFFALEDLQTGVYELELFEPILRAHERGRLVVVAPFDTELYGTKRAFALLTDDRWRAAYPVEDRTLLDRLLPWTRELRTGRITVGADEVDLVEYCREHQSELVLKPLLLHGGAGVVPGWQVPEDVWRQELQRGLRDGHVVQRRVRPQSEPFLDPATGADVDVVLNWGVFVDDAGYAGAFVRGCPDPDVGVVSRDVGASVGCCFTQRTRPLHHGARAR